MQRQLTFGGGVSPRNTRLRGQSIIEYVLIIAVIGLVVVFAGPGVAGAIRNQFSQVTNTVDSGTGGDNFISAEEKAYREAMKTVAGKEAKDWTLDEQKAAATDIAKNGTSSVVYAKAKAAMDAGTTWSVKLTNGKTMTYRIIGINHDDLADGSGKAGLTFWVDSFSCSGIRFLNNYTNKGGWEKSNIRQELLSGEVWNALPNDFQLKIASVTKKSLDSGSQGNSSCVDTPDKLFLASVSELFGGDSTEGSQYERFALIGLTMNSQLGKSDYRITYTRSVKANTRDEVWVLRGDAEPRYSAVASQTLHSFECIRFAFCF